MKVKGKIALIQVLLIFVFAICGYTVVDNVIDKNRESAELSDIKTELTPTNAPTASDVPTAKQRIDKIKGIYEINNDTVGWVRIDGTAIDYPVLHNTQSNAYYLHRDINRAHSSSGVPFLDYQCKSDGSSDNTIIYAHNMRNGTMFHDLLSYKDKAFYEEHKTVTFDTLSGIGEYEIFSVLRTNVGGKDEFKYYEFIDAKTGAEFDQFIGKCKSLSLYKTDIIPKHGDKILTLSTCSYNTNNERFVVFARKNK